MFSNFVTYATEQIPFILDQRKKYLVVMPHSDKAWHKGHIWVKILAFIIQVQKKTSKYIAVTYATHVTYATNKKIFK